MPPPPLSYESTHCHNALNSATVTEPVAPESSVPAPEPAADDVAAYAASVLAPAQVFRVRTGRDTVLVGQQGTVLAVPAGAWDLPAGGGPVRLELREFHSTPDIVLAGLSTASGPNLLETGGMVYLNATAGEQPVALRPGQRLLLRLPTARKLDGMQLFAGVGSQPPHGLDWQLPPVVQDEPAGVAASKQKVNLFDFQKDGRWPQLPGRDNALLKFFDKRIPASKATLVRLRQKRSIGPDEALMLRAYSKANHKKVLRAVRAQLLIDSTGALRPPVLLPDGDQEIGAAVLAAAAQLPKWRPARFRRLAAPHRLEKINAVGTLTVLYTSAGKRLMGVQWDEDATHSPRIAKYVAAYQAQARREGQQRFAAQFASASPLLLDENLYYELEAGGLGWINCDRFLEAGPRIEFAVRTTQPNTVVTLVFQQQRSILTSSRTEATAAVCEQVPAGASATVVAIRREKGVTFLATAATTLESEKQPNLDFRAVSLEELRAALARL